MFERKSSHMAQLQLREGSLIEEQVFSVFYLFGISRLSSMKLEDNKTRTSQKKIRFYDVHLVFFFFCGRFFFLKKKKFANKKKATQTCRRSIAVVVVDDKMSLRFLANKIKLHKRSLLRDFIQHHTRIFGA